MDEPLIAIAILSTGIFAIVLVATIVYLAAIRPNWVEDDAESRARTHELLQSQGELMQQLQHELARHSDVLRQHVLALRKSTTIEESLQTELQHLRRERREAAVKPAPEAKHASPEPDISPQFEALQTILEQQSLMLAELMQDRASESLRMKAQRQWMQKELGRYRSSLAVLKHHIVQAEAPVATSDAVVLQEMMNKLNRLQELVETRPKATSRRNKTPTIIPLAEKREQSAEGFDDTWDQLTSIKGIGNVFSNKLHEAGIHTFEILAQQDPENLRQILDLAEWRVKDTTSWIEQAKDITGQEDDA